MKLDLYKQYQAEYVTPRSPVLVTTGSAKYLAIAGRGDPMGPAFQAAVGALYGVAPFLVAQVVLMPMMGMPLFSGSVPLAMGSLIGHLIYGAAVGAVYAEGTETASTRRPLAV